MYSFFSTSIKLTCIDHAPGEAVGTSKGHNNGMTMKKMVCALVFLTATFMLRAQEKDDYFIKEWKSYYEDGISFDYLQLAANGEGVRAFGQTINGKDTLFLERGIRIIDWRVMADTLFVIAATMPGRPYYRYTISRKEKDHFDAIEENDLLRIYDKNKKNLKRLSFRLATNLPVTTNAPALPCIYDLNLFTFQETNAVYKLVKKKAIENIIGHLVNCKSGFQYVTTYTDRPFQLKLPKYLGEYSFGTGDNKFYISFNDLADSPARSIVVYYDFNNEGRDYFFKQLKEGKQALDTLVVDHKKVYRFKNWQGKYAGQLFLPNNIIVGYYTLDKAAEQQLQECIASFKFE
jgi:hypothetical protein